MVIWSQQMLRKHCILTGGDTKKELTTNVHNFELHEKGVMMLVSPTPREPRGCVTTSVKSTWATWLKHRHREMEEQFIASLCRPMLCLCRQKTFMEDDISIPSRRKPVDLQGKTDVSDRSNVIVSVISAAEGDDPLQEAVKWAVTA